MNRFVQLIFLLGALVFFAGIFLFAIALVFSPSTTAVVTVLAS